MPAEKKTVVCIEDDPDMILLIEVILRNRGFNLIGALGGREGLETVRRTKPHLILLDLMMPEMDGWEVYHRLKGDEELRDIPVIIVTARARNAERMMALRVAKVDDYVTKPFLPQELVVSVSRVLGVET